MLRLSFSAPEDSDGDGLLDREGGQGRRVTLTTDPTQDSFDRYRRLLAYVETRSGNQLNVAQVAPGWAKTDAFNDKPFRRIARFRAAERRAHGARRGVRGTCGGDFHRPASARADSSQLRSVCSRRLALGTLRAKRRIGHGQARFASIVTRPICRDLTDDGEQEFAFTVTVGGSGGDIYWGVLRRTRSGSVSVSPFESGRGFGIRLEAGELAVASPVYRRGEPGCCPSSWRVRRFGWNGRRLVVSSSRIERDVPEGFYDRSRERRVPAAPDKVGRALSEVATTSDGGGVSVRARPEDVDVAPGAVVVHSTGSSLADVAPLEGLPNP